MFDAYTARKAAPRLVLAVIGINLSIYFCLGAIDITNVVARGIGHLLTDPFIKSGNYNFGIQGLDSGSGAVSNAVGIAGGAGIFVSAGGLGLLTGAAVTAATAPLALLGMLLILAIPIALTALAVMITVVIRQGLVIFLTIVSPVAIACYVLPGTEKYFKQWLDLFVKTLIVYPIIAAIFAMSDVFGSIIFRDAQAGHNGLTGLVKIITGIIVIYAPLVLIPFAFKFAGGAMGKISKVAAGGASRVSNMGPVKGRREIAKRDLGNQMVQNRATTADRLKTYGSKESTGRVGTYLARKGAGAIGGYNIEEQASARRAQTSKILNDQIATGRDEEIRALTVNKKWADAHGVEGQDYRTENGMKQYRTLGGAWVNESDVDAAHGRWGNDQYAQQTALSYEMKKAAEHGETARVAQNYMNVAGKDAGGWGMSLGEATGAFKGAGFENQNTHLEYKHTKFKEDGKAVLDNDAFVKEIYEKKGSYPLSNMSAHTVRQLREANKGYVASGDVEGQNRVKAIAETFVQRGMGGQRLGGMDGDQPVMVPQGPLPSAQPQPQAQATQLRQDAVGNPDSQQGVILGPSGQAISTPQSRGQAQQQPAQASVYSSGAAAVNEEVFQLINETGNLVSPPTGAAAPSNTNDSSAGARQK